MSSKEYQYREVAVIGAGQAGLAISYYLKREGISHIVLERNTIASSWSDQRWDSFTLNTPNWMNLLPGEVLDENIDREAFMTKDEYVEKLQNYALRYALPIFENHNVERILRYKDNKKYEVWFSYGDEHTVVIVNQVVVASGAMSEYGNPGIAASIPKHIKQMNVAEYRNPAQVEGNVLIVGSGQSGVQLAEELIQREFSQKGNIYLATSPVARSPRRYRGKDMMEWLYLSGLMNQRTDQLTDRSLMKSVQPQVSGVGRYGHTVSLQSLSQAGVKHLGMLQIVDDKKIYFTDTVKQHIYTADKHSDMMKREVDGYIQAHQIAAPLDQDIDLADIPDSQYQADSGILQLAYDQIDTIIWAIGYHGNFTYIKISELLDEKQQPIHLNGKAPIDRFYYLGFPWLTMRKSGIIFGVKEDSERIFNEIKKELTKVSDGKELKSQ